MDRPNELHAHLAQRILGHVRMSHLPCGHHLTEQSLQALLGTSRGPIRAALAYLQELGMVERKPNHGFYVAEHALDKAETLPEQNDEALYRAVAEDRLAGRLPQNISETELVRRYDVSRHRLGRLLDRIAVEGWIEKRRGHGWAFLSLINSAQAYRECYDLRRIIEPAAMLSDSFRVDEALLADLERQQSFVVNEGYRTLSQIELFEINSRLHESLASMSNNRFVLQTIMRQNQLRRLIEYQRPIDQPRLVRVCSEHLTILRLLKAGDISGAAKELAAHLDSANTEKTKEDLFIAIDTAQTARKKTTKPKAKAPA